MGNLLIGRFFKIDVYIHWSFWILPLIVAYNSPRAALALHLSFAFATFACVLLHEYGHALAARAFGIGTRDITLYPIGGVARLERMSERPWEEFWITAAGPAVNVVLAILFGIPALLLTMANPEVLQGLLQTNQHFLTQLLMLLTCSNIMLAVFNMVPAFPMDGGRILRALLVAPMGRLEATRLAVYIGAVLAVLLGAFFFLVLHNFMMPILAFFVIMAGQQELRMVQAQYQQRQRDAEEGPLPVLPVFRTPPGATVPVILLPPLRPGTPTEPAPLFLQPRLSISTFDPATGKWVEEPRTPRRSAWDEST